ncbi:Homocysteine S-methyltransferase [Thelephora ganbajun]|uniref:Homocysteine S-methyltransferase n=1 Tax=Thelephora ganbajun TaxID=370292 RepID=A0ACB6Z5D6_THEGA|nr:Homocysteine S-methyltransferase [Thelephora ganbajun]
MKTINGSKLIILDGGLGSTLEETYKQDISLTPLWSAKPIQENPELIVDAHLAFLRAGAEIILTSTYQCSRETFEQAGYTPEEGIQIMQKSVKLADDARKAYLAEEGVQTTKTKEVFVALSLGPFGSSVKPPQDFDGFYPPPFGPKGPSEVGSTRLFSSSSPSDGDGNSDVVVEEEEKKAIEALAQFHLWRLRAVASNPETWNAIDYIAFETIPHLRELRAVKIAMAKFESDDHHTKLGSEGVGRLKGLKGWWISLVFPEGEGSVQWGPEEREHQTRSLGLDLTNDPSQSEILSVVLDDEVGAVPTGFGLNCTKIDGYLSILSSIVSEPKFVPGVEKGVIPLTLIVYPNGGRSGDTFDDLTRQWVNDGRPRLDGRNVTWEEEVVEVIQKCRDEWKDVIVGGCCLVDPPQIKELKEKVNKTL